jgi:PAS domain S-box-containing protein
MKSRKATSGSRDHSKISHPNSKTNSALVADYRLLIETFPQWVWMADAKGDMTFCNRHWYDFSGLSAEQTLRKQWIEFVHPDDQERAREIWKHALVSGKAYEAEFRCNCAQNGQYRWHLAKGIPLKDASGKVQKWIGFGIDIHDSKVAKDELADREARLRAIVDTGPECIKLLSSDGTLLEMNQAGLNILEADSPADVVGKKLIEKIVDKPYHQAFHQMNKRVFQGEEATLSYEVTGFKGSHRWLQTHVAPLRDKSGEIWAALGITWDITQQKKAEDELRASEARFRALIQHSYDGVVLFSANGDILFCSASNERILKYRPDEMVGQKMWEFVHPDDIPSAQEGFRQLFEHPQVPVTIRARIRSKDSSWRILEGHFTNLLHDPDIGAIINNFRDITESVYAVEVLRRSEEKFSKAFHAIPLPIFITTRSDVRLVACNQAALDLCGYSEQEVIGRPIHELNLWVDPQAREEFRKTLKESGQVRDFVSTLRMRSGEIRTVEFFAEFIDLEETKCVLTIARDITESLKMEAQFHQAQKMEAVGRLAGGVAHDFNNMLAVIVGYTQLLQDRLDPSDSGQKHIAQIRRACERASGLTRQLLAFSRKQVVQPRVLDLNAVVNNLSKMLLRVIGEDITLSVVPGKSLGNIRADLGQIEQSIVNLSVNARDAMPQGGKIAIQTANVYLEENHAEYQPTVVPGPYVMLSVSDTGTGMDEQTMAHIFEPFFTTKGAGKGTGLGLSMVYGIVKQSNGYVWVTSKPGEGATFKIYFPRVEEQAQPLVSQPEEPPIVRGTETVLVVEDDPSLRELVVELLEEGGYKVLEATDVEAAMNIAKTKRTIHLLLTDVIMPAMGGGDLAAHLKKLRPELRILFMSGYSGDQVADHGILEAETNLLEKPFTKHSLLSKVRTVLDR